MDFETLVRAKNELEPRVRQLVAHLDPERKATLVGNLLVVLCGHQEAQPIINTGTLYN